MMDTNGAHTRETAGEETRQIQRIASYGFLLNLGLTAMKATLAIFCLLYTSDAADE